MAIDSVRGRKPQQSHTLHLPNPQTRVIRKAQLQELLPISDTTIRRLLAEDPSFPKPIRIGPRAIGWRLAEVEAYLASRPAAGGLVTVEQAGQVVNAVARKFDALGVGPDGSSERTEG